MRSRVGIGIFNPKRKPGAFAAGCKTRFCGGFGLHGIRRAFFTGHMVNFLLTTIPAHAMIGNVVWTSRMCRRKGIRYQGVRSSSLRRVARPCSLKKEDMSFAGVAEWQTRQT